MNGCTNIGACTYVQDRKIKMAHASENGLESAGVIDSHFKLG